MADNIDLILNPKKETPSEEKKLSSDPETLVKFVEFARVDVDNRRKIDWQWFVYDNYVKGNHFVKWNTDTSTIEIVPAKGVLRFPINKIYSTLRSVRGFVTKYDPKWEVFAEDKSADSITKAGYKQKLLDSYWYDNNLKDISKQKVFEGLKYSVGITELGWDDENDEVTYTLHDPYDIYFGGPAYPYCSRVTKVVKRRVAEIENDPKYKEQVGKLNSDPNDAASEAKILLQQLTYGYQNKGNEDDDTTLLYETYYLTDKKNSLGGRINIITFTKDAILRHIETDYDSLWDIWLIYRSDVNPGESYGEGWVKHLIPPQKMLDILESQTMEYHHMFAKGRYVIPKGAGAKIITNENGVILEHLPGKRPVIENAPSMAASVDNQISRLNVYLEDLGGQHDASLGRIPTGATAGIAIEALQEGDANNLKDLVENFNIDLVNTARATLKMIAKRLDHTILVQTDDRNADGTPDFFAIIGESAKNKPEFVTLKGEKIPVCVIKNKEKVRVTVGSWLAYTRDAMEQRVYKHYTAGLIDRKTALEALNYTDPDGIVDRALKEQLVNAMVSAGPPQENPQGAGGETMPPSDGGMETAPAMSPEAAIPMPPAK